MRSFEWDPAEPLVILSAADPVDVLSRFPRGDATADECKAWAEELEMRDDVGFEPAFEALLRDLLFDVGHPEINEPLTAESAARWRSRLARPRASENVE